MTFLRCQFNTGGDPLYSVRFFCFHNTDARITKLIAGVTRAARKPYFMYVDPKLRVGAEHVGLVSNTISPMRQSRR